MKLVRKSRRRNPKREYIVNPGHRMPGESFFRRSDRFIVLVKYSGGINRDRDRLIEKTMGKGHDGSGMFLRTGIRDHSGTYATKRKALSVGRKLYANGFWVKIVDTRCPVPLR